MDKKKGVKGWKAGQASPTEQLKKREEARERKERSRKHEEEAELQAQWDEIGRKKRELNEREDMVKVKEDIVDAEKERLASVKAETATILTNVVEIDKDTCRASIEANILKETADRRFSEAKSKLENAPRTVADINDKAAIVIANIERKANETKEDSIVVVTETNKLLAKV